MNVVKIFSLPKDRDEQMRKDAKKFGFDNVLSESKRIIKVAGVEYRYRIPSEIVQLLYKVKIDKCYFMDKFGVIPRNIKLKVESRISSDNIFTTLH